MVRYIMQRRLSGRNLCSFVAHLYVSGSVFITSVGEVELICLLLFTCNYVVSVTKGSFSSGFLGWATFLLCHSLSLSNNYLTQSLTNDGNGHI